MRKIFIKTGLILLAAAFAAAACTPRERYVTVDGAMLGTTMHVSARTSVPPSEIYAAMMRIDREAKASMSVFDAGSLLSRLNAGLTDSLDRHIARNITLADSISRLSGGRYDITVKPLVEAWGFVAKRRTGHPNVDSLLQFVGYDKIGIVQGRLVKSDPRVQIDLNSIAKGYTVDLAAAMLDSLGATDYIVEVGGEIRCRGVNPRGKAWVVGIDSPYDGNDAPGRDLQTGISLSGESLATSGNYRRFYIDGEGRKVAHTIDPRTGRSSVSRLLSVTTVCADCAEADALSTMFMAMGADDALAFADSHPELPVYFILDDGEDGFEIRCTPAMRDKIIDRQNSIH